MTTIDKFSYHLIKVPIHKRDHNYNISYSKINNANKIKNIKHPVREILKFIKLIKSIFIMILTFLVKVA